VDEQLSRFLREPFLVADALAAGLTRRQLESVRFRRVFHGVRVASTVPDSLDVRCAAARLLLPNEAAFASLTAAAIVQLPVPDCDDIIARVGSDGRRPQVKGLRIIEGLWEPSRAITHRSHRITEFEQVFLDCAQRLSLTELVMLGDAMLNRGLTRIDELSAFLARASRRSGVVAARKALPHLEPRAASPGETLARLNLVALGFPRPLCGVVIYDEAHQWLAEVDMLVKDPPVVFQYDGEPHWRSDGQRKSDAIRDETVRDLDWEVLVLTNRDNRDLDRLRRRAQGAFVRAEGRRPGGHIGQPPLPHERGWRRAS